MPMAYLQDFGLDSWTDSDDNEHWRDVLSSDEEIRDNNTLTKYMRQLEVGGSTDSETEDADQNNVYRTEAEENRNIQAMHQEDPLLWDWILEIIHDPFMGTAYTCRLHLATMRATLVCTLLHVRVSQYVRARTLRDWMASSDRDTFMLRHTAHQRFTPEASDRIQNEDHQLIMNTRNEMLARNEMLDPIDRVDDLEDEQIEMLEDLLISGIPPDPYRQLDCQFL